jgi:hypothetical protein
MFRTHEVNKTDNSLTEAQIHSILSEINRIRQAEDQFVDRLRVAGLNPWATNVAAHASSKRGIVADIEATLILELPAAAQRREEFKASLQAPLKGIVDAGAAEENLSNTPDMRTAEQQVSECFKPIEL